MKNFIPYGRQDIDQDDIQAVVDTLQSDFLTTGPKIKEFEQALTRYVQSKDTVVVSSGTAGLHVALMAAGVGPGDEVLVPALSFLATANAVLYVGAKPIFVDSLPCGYNMDPKDAARKINSCTKAIIPVHFAGQPVEVEELQALAKKGNCLMIEDAAHAIGAQSQGRPVGSLSPLTVFSFHPVKHITSGEGGAVAVLDEKFAAKIRRLRHHGIDVGVVERDANKQWSYDMVDLGYNYRLTDFQCALGMSQLKKSEQFLEQREKIVERYHQAFSSHAVWDLPPVAKAGDRHAWHLYILRLKPTIDSSLRDKYFKAMRDKGVGAHVHYQPIYWHSYYQKLGWKKGACPEIEKTFQRMLTIPMFSSMTDEMVERVISAVNETAMELGLQN